MSSFNNSKILLEITVGDFWDKESKTYTLYNSLIVTLQYSAGGSLYHKITGKIIEINNEIVIFIPTKKLCFPIFLDKYG